MDGLIHSTNIYDVVAALAMILLVPLNAWDKFGPLLLDDLKMVQRE